MNGLQYSRLCCFLHDSLHPFTEKSEVSITKQQEKDLLIVLSQVLNQIKLWTVEFDSDTDDGDGDQDDSLVNLASSSECINNGSMCHSSASQCIFKIISDLVLLLAIESRYVQHVAGNVLVAVAEFVVASESYWDEFMQTMCFFLELTICNLLSPSLDQPSRAKFWGCDLSTSKLWPILDNTSWFSVGGVILVLRNVLKQLKDLDDVQLIKAYFNFVGSCLPSIPWDLCNEVSVGQNGDASRDFCRDALINNNVRQPKSWFEFCGYLVQLFCSLTSQSSLVRASANSHDKHPAIQVIFDVIPKILAWCHSKQGEYRNNMSISHYVQHKILVLMIRLSSLVHLDCEMAVSWLHIIHTYFQDVLYETLTLKEAGQNDCLEDSPFLQCFPDLENNRTSRRHLQRLVVFLFLRCSFSFISSTERSKDQRLCVDLKFYSKKGVTELYEWLLKHLPADILVNSELYSDRCKCFAKSFLQLYMHEDDMLFEVLLQLSYMPFGSEQQISKEWTSQAVESNILFLLLDVFHPVQLFHLVLVELHYDHQVLLDYLISKDTGVSSAEYILRSLRVVCDSWNSFLGFSFGGEIGNQPSCKRRKVTMDDSHLQPELSSSDVKSDEILLSSEMDRENQRSCQLPFQNATECLLSLKNSVENLNRKELFPYNPEVLLRRCASFEPLDLPYTLPNIPSLYFCNLL